MDNDLISRQAAIEKAETAAEFWSNADDFAEGVHAGYLLAANLIKALPSAERRGRWKFDIDDEEWSWDVPFKCTQCGEWNGRETPYCPNCGSFNGKDNLNEKL